MASSPQEAPLTFEKGLVTEVEDSVLDTGQASALVNWEASPNGSLRTRNSWSGISTTGLTAPYEVRGWGTAPVGSGGGYVTPAIVQETAAGGVESGTETASSSKTATLNGCTAGNILIGLITLNDDNPSPTITAGYTTQINQVASANARVMVVTKTSVGGTEALNVQQATNEVVHVHLLEVSGLASETPTDTDSNSYQSGSPASFSCTSVTGTGFAVSLGQAYQSAFTDAPSLSGGVTQFNINDDVSISASKGVTANYSSSPVTDTQENDTFSISSGGVAIWDAATQAAVPANFYLLMAVATSTGYSIYRILRDSVAAGTWELVDSDTATDNSAFVSMSVGAGTLVWSASTMDQPRAVILNTLTGSDVAQLAGLAGRTVCYHKDRMFVGGSSTNPARLYFSAIGDPDNFTIATDYLDIGGDDGEAIEDLVSVEGLLLVCKVNRLYLISGSGIESFFVNELPGGSASTGRPAIRTPYGTIVVGATDVWVVQGGGVDPMSRSLGGEFVITGLVSTAYAQDSVLIADTGSGNIYRLNLVTGAWGKEVTDGVYNVFSLNGRLYYGTNGDNTVVGGTRKLSDTRNYDSTTGTMELSAATGRMSLVGPGAVYTPRYIYLQVRSQNDASPNVLSVTVEAQNGTRVFEFEVTEQTQRYTRGLGWTKGSDWLKISFGAVSSVTAAAIDVERAVMAYDSEGR